MSKHKKKLELLYKRIRETESEARRKSIRHQEAIEDTLILLSDLTTILYNMLGEMEVDYLSPKEQFIKEIWQKKQELKSCRPQDKHLIEKELAEMKQEYQEYLEFQSETKGGQ